MQPVFDLCVRHKATLIPLGLMILNALLWVSFATLGGNAYLHSDSMEAYIWGHEFQLGYYKHPPFWAWIAGAWFSVFPHTDWAFYFLSEVNASLGILGAWALLGRFTKGPERLAGTVLLLLTTFYTFNALRFNANTIQLSIWPWAMYFFVLSVEKKTLKSGLIFGLLAGIAVLSKYYALILLFTCGLAAFFHKDRREYLRSPAPWSAVLVFALVIAPHVFWVVQHDFQPFVYAAEQTEHPKPSFFDTSLGFLIACILYHIVQLSVIFGVKLRRNARPFLAPNVDIEHGLPFLAILSATPFVLTLIIGLLGFRITPLYIIPIFSLMPFLILSLIGAEALSVARASSILYAAIVVGSIVVAPYMPSMRVTALPQPGKQISAIAVDEWKNTVQAPLRLVTGSRYYSQALAFYAPGDVSEFTEFNFKYAPWITKQRIKQEGLLILCLSADQQCLDRSTSYKKAGFSTLKTAVVSKLGSFSGPEVAFTIYVIPPENTQVSQR